MTNICPKTPFVGFLNLPYRTANIHLEPRKGYFPITGNTALNYAPHSTPRLLDIREAKKNCVPRPLGADLNSNTHLQRHRGTKIERRGSHLQLFFIVINPVHCHLADLLQHLVVLSIRQLLEEGLRWGRHLVVLWCFARHALILQRLQQYFWNALQLFTSRFCLLVFPLGKALPPGLCKLLEHAQLLLQSVHFLLMFLLEGVIDGL
mmetsp:Transcript_12220/g.22160  ORF Transcript_12220/g.22160 Transcript_12220/m.22160 type:complete len:206 (-) Transcript_12220:695-1312(-)